MSPLATASLALVPPRSAAIGRAHAKAIVMGEHAVVYGSPALAIPLRRLAATAHIRPASAVHIDSALYSGSDADAPEHLQPVVTAIRSSLAHAGIPDQGVRVRIGSAIPHERGLGSSAAVAAAIAQGIAAFAGRPLSRAQCHAIVQEAESAAHGRSSGIDAHAVVSDRPFLFSAGEVQPLPVGAPLTFVLADSGIPGSTSEAVTDVRSRRARRRGEVDGIIDDLAATVRAATDHIARGDREGLGAQMSDAHGLLTRLGVSSTALDALVAAAGRAGALGAKLTGGGLGGCILALAETPEHASQLADALKDAGAPRTWTVPVDAA